MNHIVDRDHTAEWRETNVGASRIEALGEGAASFLGKYSFAVVALFTVVYVVCAFARARQVPMWHDELYSYYLSHLSAADLWRALAAGVDLTPPTHHLLAKAFRTLFGDSALAVRMPAVIGVWTLSVSLYAFVRRRCAPVYAVLALFVPCSTLAFRYSYEARPYGVLLGCVGAALACWQATHSGPRRKLALFGLSAALALASGTHYYGILIVGPLAVAELVRSIQARRLDVPVWLSFVVAGLPLLAYGPLIAAARSFSKTFWSTGGPAALVDTYLLFVGSGVVPILATLVVLPLVLFAFSPRAPRHRAETEQGFTLAELVACAGIALLPLMQIALSQLATGAYVYRYGLPAIAGLSILFVWLIATATQRNFIAAVVVVGIFAGWFAREVISSSKLVRQPREAISVPALLDRVPAGTPVVISEPMTYLQLAHYAPRELASRMYYLVDTELPGKFSESNTVERNFVQLRRWRDLSLVDYREFVGQRNDFVLFHRRAHDGRVWLISQLLADGWQVTLQQQMGEDLLYTVRRSPVPSASNHPEAKSAQNAAVAHSITNGAPFGASRQQ